MYDLSDRVALVTGASRGIGRRVAEMLASNGARVALASRAEEDVKICAQEISQQGGNAFAVGMNVAVVEEVKEGIARILNHYKKVDILVNNAGVVRDNLILRMDDEEWRKVLATNLDGVYYVARAIIPDMLRQRYGRIINVTSVVGQMGNSGQVNYVSSKAGVIGFTKALAREVASRNITVNAVAPGFIKTDMTAGLTEKVKQDLQNQIPLKRLGSVEDVASSVLFLASKEAGYITGHVLNINGGMYM